MKTAPLYNPKAAWHRALVYFAICWLVGWGSGSVPHLLTTPLVTVVQWGQLGWWVGTAVCLLIILVGYGYIWPKGTETHGRPLHWPTVLLFGLLWGSSEGVLFVSVWWLVNQWVASEGWVVLFTFLLLATFIGLWHALYWDIYVAPEHNIAAWNGRKVLFAHTPNLLLTLAYLTFFGNMAIFVLLQTIALLFSTFFMRFPPYGKYTFNGHKLTFLL